MFSKMGVSPKKVLTYYVGFLMQLPLRWVLAVCPLRPLSRHW